MSDKTIILKEKIKYLITLFKKISKEKRILGILSILLIGFVLYQSLIAIQMVRLKAIDFQFISQRRLFDFYSRLVKGADSLMSETKEKEKSLSLIKERFVDEEGLSDYFASFRDLVKSYNLQIVTLDFKPQEPILDLNKRPLTYCQKLPFNVSIKGGYYNIMSLLYKLEQDSPVFDIKTIRIRQDSPDSYETMMDMDAAVCILMKKV